MLLSKPDCNAHANASISLKGETCRPLLSTEEMKIEGKRQAAAFMHTDASCAQHRSCQSRQSGHQRNRPEYQAINVFDRKSVVSLRGGQPLISEISS